MSRPELAHDVRITDTTLRDGSHAMAHQFTETQVRDTVRALDGAGVEVIEVSHGDGVGGSSFNYGFSHTDEMRLVAAAREEARRAKIAVLLVPGIGTVEDLKQSRDAGADMVRVATRTIPAPASWARRRSSAVPMPGASSTAIMAWRASSRAAAMRAISSVREKP